MNHYKIYYYLSVFFILTCISCSETKKQEEKDSQKIEKDSFLYDIKVNGYAVQRDTVRNRETLALIMYNAGLKTQVVHQLISQCDTLFDVHKLKKGNTYTKMYSDSLLVYFIYEIDNTDYLVFDMSDSISNVYKGHKKISYKERFAKGTIESSLWNAMVEAKLDPNLAIELSDIYAWSIDFWGLQKNDFFKIVFIEKYIDSVPAGVDRIKYALFNHLGQDCYAIPFEQDGIEHFFDEQGNSIKKAFLKAPLKYRRISSYFSSGRRHPILKIVRPHYGVDYAAPVGTPVNTIGDGVVIERKYSGGAGNMIKIKHNSSYTTTYMHLSKFASGISVGKRVRQGDVIGYVGSSGLSTGPHLDFRVYKNGKPINPLKMISPPAEPIKKENMPAYKHICDSLLTILNSF